MFLPSQVPSMDPDIWKLTGSVGRTFREPEAGRSYQGQKYGEKNQQNQGSDILCSSPLRVMTLQVRIPKRWILKGPPSEASRADGPQKSVLHIKMQLRTSLGMKTPQKHPPLAPLQQLFLVFSRRFLSFSHSHFGNLPSSHQRISTGTSVPLPSAVKKP